MRETTLSFFSVPHSRRAELMDDPDLSATDHLLALHALARINKLSCTASLIGNAVLRILAQALPTDKPLHIIDVACGGGDVTIALSRRLNGLRVNRSFPAVRITGIDISPRAIDRATSLARDVGAIDVSFHVLDVVTDGCPPCDIATSSLFLHHLDDEVAQRVMSSLAKAASMGCVVSDLVRSPIGLVLAVLGTALLSRSKVACIDGPLSVRAARTSAEYRQLLDRTGLCAASIRRVWPERVLLEWLRSSVP